MKGSLQLSPQDPKQGGPGAQKSPPLVLGLAAALDTGRLVRWQYNSAAGGFVTTTQVNATWEVAAGATTTPVAVFGMLQLVSPGWPGPGLTGAYRATGNLPCHPTLGPW